MDDVQREDAVLSVGRMSLYMLLKVVHPCTILIESKLMIMVFKTRSRGKLPSIGVLNILPKVLSPSS